MTFTLSERPLVPGLSSLTLVNTGFLKAGDASAIFYYKPIKELNFLRSAMRITQFASKKNLNFESDHQHKCDQTNAIEIETAQQVENEEYDS